MARRIRISAPAPIEWIEPPVTKEEVAESYRHPNGGWYRDVPGDGGGYQADVPLDETVFPQDRAPSYDAMMARQAKREADIEEIKHEHCERLRDLSVTVGNVTGERTGPPSLFETGHKEED